MLFEDNHVALGVNLDGISLCDIEGAAKLDRYYDSSEVVKFSDYTGGFQICYSLSSFVICICFFANTLFICRIITYCNCLSMQNWKLFSSFFPLFAVICGCFFMNTKGLGFIFIFVKGRVAFGSEYSLDGNGCRIFGIFFLWRHC